MTKKKSKPSSSGRVETKLGPLHYILLIALPLLVFGRMLLFDFVKHDDDKMILENPLLEQGAGLQEAFTTDAWFMDARIELYRPWQSITYIVDYAIGGENPLIYHLHNLLAFLAGVVLLFIFLRFYVSSLLAWAGAMLYSVNLLAPHAAGWIAARGDLYLMVFGLGFLVLFLRYLKQKNKASLWLSVPVFFLALLAKESAVALIPIAGVMLYAERRKMPAGMEWGWMGVLLAVFAGYFMMRSGAIADAGNLSPAAFVSNLRSIPEEVFKMLLPLGFSVMPGYHIAWTLGGVLLITGLVVLVRKSKLPASVLWTGLAIVLFCLLPSMVYEPSFAGVAYDYLDHRAWFPFTGLWLIVVGVVDQYKWHLQAKAKPVFIGVLVVWSCVNLWQIGKYENWQLYYGNAIATNPESGLANLNYGSLLRDQGNWEEALPYVEKGVSLSPDYTDAKVRLAEVYFTLKRYDESVAIADQALAKEPNNISALQFKGSALGASGQPLPAIEVFKKIIEIAPDNPHAHFNLGIAYRDAGRLDEAVAALTKLLEINPDFPNGYYERGFCFGKMNLLLEANKDMEASIQRQPEHGPSYFFRGRTRIAMGDKAGACADWSRALELGTVDAQPFFDGACR